MKAGRGRRFALPLHTLLLLSHAFVLVLPIAVLIGSGALSSDLRAQTRDDLRNQAALIALLVEGELHHSRLDRPDANLVDIAPRLDPALKAAKLETLAAVRLLDANGIVVATSGDELGEDLSDREEVREAMAGALGEAIRPRDVSRSSQQPLSSPSRRARVRMFVATPIVFERELLGLVVLSRTPREEVQALYQMVPAWGVALALGLTAVTSFAAAHIYTRSLRKLVAASHRVAEGSIAGLEELERPATSRVREVGAVAEAVWTMAARLQARLGYIAEFAGNVSHEFKTPIATLKGTAELLRDDPEMSAQQRSRFLHNALLELDRMERLITGLLELARAEEGRGYEPIRLDELIGNVASRSPDVEVVGQASTVSGNAAQLEAVLQNLVDNAYQHGGPDVRVQIVGFCTDRITGFEVVDDGQGVSPANVARVFDRFFTTDRAGGGTGLGLALARAIAAAHGGSIEVRSRPGETRFVVSLPQVDC